MIQGREKTEQQAGFTLIELMIVMAIIVILASIAAGRYTSALTASREAVLAQDLETMRDAIDHYTADKDAAPSSLDDLKDAGYLRVIPVDPMTGQQDWVTVSGDTIVDPDQSTIGIVDVHSASDKVSPFKGTPYSSW
ncbi:MAG TPA: type II secretion system protein [Verrucomicrobiae bacterium]|nr:type II secretion system protein [Verrucomicrobiae bacterium]